MQKSFKKVILVRPRGFCAGVARSIQVVEDCLKLFGAPLYIKHAIVHNKTVVEDLENKGAVTVETVEEIPDGSYAVFSAHGSPPEDFEKARKRNIKVIDATCPLVTKVHIEIVRFIKEGRTVVYIGHRGHVEGVGVIGEAKKYGLDIELIESVSEVEKLHYKEDEKIAVLTQTTLSLEETDKILKALRQKYPNLEEPKAKDICYATTNRQSAVKELAAQCDCIFVIGSVSSSNSNRLREVVESMGVEAYLINGVEDLKLEYYRSKIAIGITAGASAPEYKVQEVVDFFTSMGAKKEELEIVEERVQFTEPRELTELKNNKNYEK